MKALIKIRGVYATALTKFFIDKEFTVVSPSKLVAQRFKIGETKSRKPAAVVIADLENQQGISLHGEPDQVGCVVEIIRNEFKESIRRTTSSGESTFIEIEFPGDSKIQLDGIRQTVVPTVLNHHRLRLINSALVDLIETTKLPYHPEKRVEVSNDLENRLVWETYTKGKKIGIEHVKLSGQVISLSEGDIVEADWKTKTLTLKRIKFKRGNSYDGLGIPKQHGDYAITTIKEGGSFYKHTYLRQNNQIIGEYYNINTSIELYPNTVRYVDLEIDVVRWPDGTVKIIDEDVLDRYARLGFIHSALREQAREIAYGLRASLLHSTSFLH
ncbi:MAG: DUF402 domain-containing protein [Deltaproteobacteria bacterium]|nr:DUF402 domain-containing protein [Deltaproteobacteria bacterium]